MAKAPVNEVFSTLKSYARKLSDGERTPAEIASALNDWAHESGQTLKAKISEEVEAAVLKMGFVKREEFDALVREERPLMANEEESNLVSEVRAELEEIDASDLSEHSARFEALHQKLQESLKSIDNL